MVLLRIGALLAATCVVPLLRPQYHLLVSAEGAEGENDAGEVTVEDDDAEGQQASEGQAPSEEQTAMDAQKFISSAKQLKEKLSQLKALLKEKDGELGGELRERVAGLEATLGSLGLDSLNEESSVLVDKCLGMAMSRAGLQRPSTIGMLRKIVSPTTTLEDVKGSELMRMAAVCMNEVTQEELEDVKGASIPPMPKRLAEQAMRPESSDVVLAITPEAWAEIKHVAEAFVNQLTGEQSANSLPIFYGVIAGIPVLLMVGFLMTRFLAMQKDKAAKKDKSKKKNK